MIPIISVIVSIYNAEKTLRRCLNCILEQTFTDFELLLINDGSSDSSVQICDEYVRNDIRVRLFHKVNGGVSSARNVGLQNARGKWITFCDADDFVDKEWLMLFVENIQDNQLVVQRIIPHTNKPSFDFGLDYEGNIKDGLQLMYKKGIVGYLFVKLFLNAVIKKNKLCFNENFLFREDEDFVLRYLQCISKMISVDKGAYHYIMPDLSTKYLSVDTFYCSLSMYSTIKEILGCKSRISQNYLQQLTNSLFDAYSKQDKKCKEKLSLYVDKVNDDFLLIKELSCFSKLAFMCNKIIAHNFFYYKARLRYLINHAFSMHRK